MIRPLHMILSGETLGDITSPIDAKVAELENVSRTKEAETVTLATKAAETVTLATKAAEAEGE